MYPFERFSERAKRVLMLAQEEAERAHHSYIGTEHLLLGLLREDHGIAHLALTNLGIGIEAARATIEAVLGREERVIIQQIIPTSRVKRVIEVAFDEARSMGDHHVGTEHILVGLMIEGEGIAAHVLTDLGADLERVRAEVKRLRADGSQGIGSEGSQGTGAGGSQPRQLGFRVGGRVLVHDPDPPYRLWEAKVTEDLGQGRFKVSLEGHPGGADLETRAERMHTIPGNTYLCPLCRAS